MYSKTGIIVLFFITLSTMSCNSYTNLKSDGEVKDAVMHYNELLAQSYKDLNMNSLTEAATLERATKAYHHMSAIGEGKSRMLATLKKVQFVDIHFPNSKEAEVTTKEEWDYTYNNISTDVVEFSNSVKYTLLYNLIKTSSKWLVADITVKSKEEQKGSNKVPYFKRPGALKELNAKDNILTEK